MECRDNEGHTPLHIATMCTEEREKQHAINCVQFLLGLTLFLSIMLDEPLWTLLQQLFGRS